MEHPLSATYGLRLGSLLQSADDFHRHRHRINLKLKKLRHALGITTRDTRNYKEKQKISTISAENYDESNKYGEVILYQIERDLLYAEETKLLLDVHASKSKQRFLVSKYKKALSNSKHLLEVTSDEKNKYVLLELLTYIAIVQGSFCFSRKHWDSVLNSFSIARCSLNCLYKYQEDGSSNVNRELYLDIIDNVVDPGLKIAQLELAGSRNPDLGLISRGQAAVFADTFSYLKRAVDIVKSIDPELVSIPDETEAEKLITSVSWRSYTAELNSADEAKAIMKAQKAASEVVNSDTASFDAALLAYQNALTLKNQEIGRGDAYSSDEQKQEAQIVLTYLKYNYLMLRIRRDATLLSAITAKDSSPSKSSILRYLRNSWKMQDGICSSLKDIRELPGVANDDDLVDTLSSTQYFYETAKVLGLARGYLASDKCSQSLALAAKAKQICDGISPLKEDLAPGLPNNDDIKDIRSQVDTFLSRAHILTVYQDKNHKSGIPQYLIDQMNRFPDTTGEDLLKTIAPLTLKLEPVNVKPVLFDIAFNYIDYGGDGVKPTVVGVEDTTSAKETPASSENDEKKKKGGFFGLFGH